MATCNMMHFSTVSTSQLKHFQLKVLWCADMSDNCTRTARCTVSIHRARIENVPFVMWLVSTEDVTFKSKLLSGGGGGLKPIKLSDLIPHFPSSVQISCSPSFMFYWANTFVCISSWNYIVCGAWISPWFCPSRHNSTKVTMIYWSNAG